MGLASRGLRDMDDGPREIEDADELLAVKSQAARIHRVAVVTAALLTAVSLVL